MRMGVSHHALLYHKPLLVYFSSVFRQLIHRNLLKDLTLIFTDCFNNLYYITRFSIVTRMQTRHNLFPYFDHYYIVLVIYVKSKNTPFYYFSMQTTNLEFSIKHS